MYKAFKYRLYPNESQKILLEKHFGACRFIWNLALETKQTAYTYSQHNYSRYDLQSQIVELKNDCQWLREVSAQSLQSVLLHLDKSYKSFFKNGGFPKYKSKKDKQSFHIPQKVKVVNGKLSIPKFRKNPLKVNFHRPLEGKIKSITISKTPSQKYFVSFLCELEDNIISKAEPIFEESVGVDLGIKDFLVTSEGDIINNPRYLKNSISRLRVLQKRVSKKQKGSKNRKKAILKVAKHHEKIRNQRQDFLHKVSTKLIRENQTICLETLNVKGMLRNNKLSQSISDVSWSEFNRLLQYKSDWYGVNILRVAQFSPTSKTCYCGVKNNGLKLSDRVWKCKSCGKVNERDLLAAENIRKFAFNDYQGRSFP